jgi:hypothetical protein
MLIVINEKDDAGHHKDAHKDSGHKTSAAFLRLLQFCFCHTRVC